MTRRRTRTLLLAIALAHAGRGCGASHTPVRDEEQQPTTPVAAAKPDSALPVPAQHEDEPADAAAPDLRPPPATNTGALPPADPACPNEAPDPGNSCSVAPGSALSCAWQVGDDIERCVCIWREGVPAGTPLAWNCDEGVSGEGPAINLCPDTPPTHDSPCLVKGNNCRYGAPYVVCDCDPRTMRWNCDGSAGAQGGP